jgi:BirA family biotin operon repressor/biotin-[acetyl-CoA-carboxylase] ligase
LTLRTVLSGLLRANGYVSGGALAREAGVSRNTIWKAVEQLRADGYQIEAVPRRGYRLIGSPDCLRDYEVSFYLKTADMGKRIHCLDRVDSTNLYAKQEARRGAPHGTLVVSEEQTAGRGRLGRTWTSWPGASLCFSLVLRPDGVAPAEAPQLTHVAAVAVAGVLRSDLGIDARLKWPNDIVVDGRKVCGILVEMSCELDLIHYVVLGVGINVHRFPGGLDSGLAGTAAALDEFVGAPLKRAPLLAEILASLEQCYSTWADRGFEEIRREVKSLSCSLGWQVEVSAPDGLIAGVAVDIDSQGALVVKERSGVLRKIYAGDVSA